MKNLMKKPAAAMKKMKKGSACIKRPAMTSAAAAKQRRYREKVLMKKEQEKKKNVWRKATRAARNGLPYQTKLAKLEVVAAAAYAAAEANSRKAMERADSAHEAADSAHEAADIPRRRKTSGKSLADACRAASSKLCADLDEKMGTLLGDEWREAADSAHDARQYPIITLSVGFNPR